MAETVDVVVIGLGPGGEHVGVTLAKAGMTVVGVEARLLGGECPYWACIPTKMMVRATDSLAEAHRVRELAGSVEVQPDWTPVAKRIREDATDNWDDADSVERFEKAGGRFVRGHGRISAPGEVTVTGPDGESVYRAGHAIVLNPGTEPAIPPIKGIESVPYWTNRDAVAVQRVPDSLIVLGGGTVGCEFAQVFARFGVAVTVLEQGSSLLSGAEPEVSDLLGEVFAGEGIDVRTGSAVTEVTADPVTAHLEDGSTVTAEALLVATGRRTDLRDLGVGAVGLDEDGHTIDVDEHMRAADKVWAIGDVTGKGAFTHVSMYQARIAAADILGRNGETADYRAVPHVTFTDPEIGAVGITEAQARQRGVSVRTGTASIPSSTRGWIHKAGNAGVIKLVEDAESGVLVGATAAGPAGGEVLGALAVAVHAGVPTKQLRTMMYAFPTFHRAIEDALGDLTSE